MRLKLLLLFLLITTLGLAQQTTVSSLEKSKRSSEQIRTKDLNQRQAQRDATLLKKKDNPRTVHKLSDEKGIHSRMTIDELVPEKASPQDNVSPFDAVASKKEITEKRDLYSKTYQNTDGSFTALIGAGPIHYQKNGQFLDIDHKITQNPNSDFPFVNATNLFESYFGATAHKGVKNKTAEGEVSEFLNTKMYWEVNGQAVNVQSANNSPIYIDNDKAYYKNIYGNISAEFTTLTGKRELNYIIPSQSDLGVIPSGADYLVFSEEVVLPMGWSHETTAKGIVLKNNLGQSVYLYSNPISKDSEFRLERDINTIYESIQIGQTLTIKTKVKATWLLSGERVYPVMVDPTVNVQANGGRSVAPDGFEKTLGLFGISDGNETRYHIKFNTSSIPTGSTINNATGYLNIYGHDGSYWSGNAPEEAFVLKNSIDPFTNSGVGLFNSATTVLSLRSPDLGYSWGYHDAPMLTVGVNYIQSNYASGAISLAACPDGNYTTNDFFGSRTHSDTDKPYISIDYTLAGGCIPPSNLNVDTITKNSARFTWTAASPAPGSGYDYYYNTTGIAPTGGPSGTVGAGITTRTQTGLTPNTVYHFWIRSKCSSSSTSDWIYGGYFNTLPNYDCIHDEDQGQVRKEYVNGNGITSTGDFRVADDFVVPTGQTMDIKQISIEVLSQSVINNATINIRTNNAGAPGAVVRTISMSPSLSQKYPGVFGFDAYHLVFNIPASAGWAPLTAGTYWLEPTMTNSGGTTVFWVMVDESYGAVVQNSGTSGSTWIENDDDYDTVFFVAGICEEDINCMPVTATADKYVVCAGEQVTLTASSVSSGYTYRWYTDWDNDTHTGTLVGTGPNISVSPTESTLYGVVATKTGCPTGVNAAYQLISIAVTPPPTLIVLDPIEAIACSDEFREISVIDGGFIPNEALDENWDGDVGPWTTNAIVYGGGSASDATWHLYLSGGVASPDNSTFVAVSSDLVGDYDMESSLVSPPISLLDYNTPINLTFNHYYSTYYDFYPLFYSTATVEISEDGGLTWTVLKTYTGSDVGSPTSFASETINLNAYAGKPYLILRFHYEGRWDDVWAIDDIKITGSPKPTTITWSPTSGLYTDAAGANPYTGGHATTLYASPASTTTYTVSASTAVGCPASTTVTVERGDKIWQGTNTNWAQASNWTENSVPTADHCVKIPNIATKPIINGTTNAFAKNLTVDNGGGLTINNGGSLSVTDYITNNSAKANFVIKNGANLVQINDMAVNTGDITQEKQFDFSADRKEYNFVISPLVGFSIGQVYPDTTYTLRYDETDNYFKNDNGSYVAGKGFAVKEATGSGVAVVQGKFEGVPFNGELSIQLKKSGTENGYNLIGNPYPSVVDIKQLYDANSGIIEEDIYFWDNRGNSWWTQEGSNYGNESYHGNQYAVYNAQSDTGNGAPTATGYGTPSMRRPNRYVKPGTGFLVRAKSNNVNLEFNNNYRSIDNSGPTFAGRNMEDEGDFGRYWVSLKAPTGLTSTVAIVYFQGGNNNYWLDDSQAFGSSDEIYSIVGSHQLGIQGKEPFQVYDVINLGFRGYLAGIYTIDVLDVEGVFADGQKIFLRDKDLGVFHDFDQGSYTFKTRAGEFNNRFEIVYLYRLKSSENANLTNSVQVQKINHQIEVSSDLNQILEVEFFNINGRSILKADQINSHTWSVPVRDYDKQIIVVVVKTETGEVVTKKLVNK